MSNYIKSFVFVLGFILAKETNAQHFLEQFIISSNIGMSYSLTSTDNSQYFKYRSKIGDFFTVNLFYNFKENYGVLFGLNIQGFAIDVTKYRERLEENYPDFIILSTNGYNPNEFISISSGLFYNISFKKLSIVLCTEIGYQIYYQHPYSINSFLKEQNNNNYLELYYSDINLENKISLIESIETRISIKEKFGVTIKSDLLIYTPRYNCQIIKNELLSGIDSQLLSHEKLSLNALSLGLGIYKKF